MAWAVRALINEDHADSLQWSVLQWIDGDAAQAWLGELAYQVSRPDPSMLTDPSAMRARCMDLAHAVGQFCRALNLPMPIVEPYREAVYHRHWVSWGGDGVTEGAWIEDTTRALQANGGGFVREHYGEPGSAEYARAVTTAAYESRVGLDVEGLAHDDWWNAETRGEWLALFQEDHPNAFWSGWWVRWSNDRPEFLVPFSETWAILYGTASELVRVGVDRTLIAAQATCVQANVNVFRSLPAEVLARYNIESADGLEYAASQMREARNIGHYAPKIQTGIRAGTGAASLILGPLTGGLAAVILGAFDGLVEVLFALLPASTQHLDDVWGRAMPVFERSAIEGTGLSETPPRFEVAPAPRRFVVRGESVPWVVPLLPARPVAPAHTAAGRKKKSGRFRSYPRRRRSA